MDTNKKDKIGIKLYILALLSFMFFAVYAWSAGLETATDMQRAAKSKGLLKDTLAGQFINNGSGTSVYGILVLQMYNTLTCSENPLALPYGNNVSSVISFLTPAIPISATTPVTIGENALYMTIWNTIGAVYTQGSTPQTVKGLSLLAITTAPGGVGGLSPTSMVCNNATDGTTCTYTSPENNTLPPGPPYPSGMTTGFNVITDMYSNSCISVTCYDSTQTCVINTSGNLVTKF